MEHDRDTPFAGDQPDDPGLQQPPEAQLSSADRDRIDRIDPVDRIEEGSVRMAGTQESGRESIGEDSGSPRNRVASQLESIGDRIEERARDMEQAGGVQRRAGQAALRASEAIDESAEYIRSHDMTEMRDDLERAIRDRPLVSVGIAIGAGFLIGRLLRD